MHTESASPDRPLPAELPLGFAAAFLAMSAVFAASPASDKPFLVGFCLAVATVAGVLALVMRCRAGEADTLANHH